MISPPRPGEASSCLTTCHSHCVCARHFCRGGPCSLPREKAEAAFVPLFLSLPCPQAFSDIGSYSPLCPHIIHPCISSLTQQTSIGCTLKKWKSTQHLQWGWRGAADEMQPIKARRLGGVQGPGSLSGMGSPESTLQEEWRLIR